MKIVGKIFAVLYSFIFFLLLLSMSILIASTNLLKGEFYADVLNNIDLDEIDANSLGLSDKEGATLEDVLVDKLNEAGFPKGTSEALLNDKEIKSVVGDVIGQVVNYKINNEKVPEISKKQAQIILNNKNVKAAIDVGDFSDEDMDEVVKQINAALKEFCMDGGLE